MPLPPPPPRPGSSTRAAPRYTIKLSAEVRLAGRLVTMATRNLFTGGVCLAGKVAFPESSELTIGLFLVEDGVEDASTPPLELAGVVQWADDGGGGQPAVMGIRFMDISPAQSQRLTDFLKKLPQDP